MLNIGFIKKYISVGIGGYLVLVITNHFSQTFFHWRLILAPLIISFCIKYLGNRLLLESFIELQVHIGFHDLPACK